MTIEKQTNAEKQTNTFIIMEHSGNVHSLTMTREEGKIAKIVTNGDIKMLQRRWRSINEAIENYFEEQTK